MTKFILHGGRTKLKNENNKNFFKECVKGFVEPVRILLICYSTRNIKDWESKKQKDAKKFVWALPDKKIEFTIAELDRKKLIEQIQQTNIVFLRGGETEFLFDRLEGLEKEKNCLQVKLWLGHQLGLIG